MFLTEFHGTETVPLAASAPDVFDLLVDVDRLPEWNAHIHHVIERPEPQACRGRGVGGSDACHGGQVAEPRTCADR